MTKTLGQRVAEQLNSQNELTVLNTEKEMEIIKAHFAKKGVSFDDVLTQELDESLEIEFILCYENYHQTRDFVGEGETLRQYIKKAVELSANTRIMNVDDEIQRIHNYYDDSNVSLDKLMTIDLAQEIEALFLEEYCHHYEYRRVEKEGEIS